MEDDLITQLAAIVGPEAVLSKYEDLVTYECDGYVIQRGVPRAVVFPSTTEEVSAVVKCLSAQNVPFIPRGAGTGLSGGAIPLEGR